MDSIPVYTPDDFADFFNRECPEIYWSCKKLFPERQPDYFAQRRKGSRTLLLSEYPRISFKKLDLVLQGRLFEVSYPVILVMLHESSRFFSSLKKIRRKIFAVHSLDYSRRVDPSIGWMADVVLFVVDQVTESEPSPYSPADLPKFVIYNHINYTFFYPRNFLEIPRNFSNQPNVEIVGLHTKNQRGLFLEDSNFEKLLGIMSKFPKLTILFLDEFDLPKNWEQIFLDQMANSSVEIFELSLTKENSCEINVPKLYELCQKCPDITFVFHINEVDYTIPTFGYYFHLKFKATKKTKKSFRNKAYQKCRLMIGNWENTAYFTLNHDLSYKKIVKIV